MMIVPIKPWTLVLLLVGACTLTACKKYLDAKSDQKLVIPTTVGDLQALLDNPYRINLSGPGYLEAGTDDYFLTTDVWKGLPEWDRRQYTWEKDYLFKPTANDWSYIYDNVYRANVVLDYGAQLKVGQGQEAAAADVRGQAYFLRAHSFVKAALMWAPAYHEATASADLGIPLRLDPDFNKPSVRASVAESYGQILRDLREAVPLLPLRSLHVLRPSRPAAYALLARTCLAMGRYPEAERYADSCLGLQSELLDYNGVDTAAPFPFQQFHREVLYYTHIGSGAALHPGTGRIDTVLYDSYSADDLRRSAFFQPEPGGYHSFRGSYSGYEVYFDGIALPEVYLTRAECRARRGDGTGAMDDLNKLLEKRYRAGTFVPLTAGSAAEALQLVLTERRKEQVMRFTRWMDLKRLNREGAGITLRRVVDGKTYILPPNDPRYALPIPESVIELSGMPQNPR